MKKLDDELRVRCTSDLKKSFKRVAHATDRTMAQLIRDYMRRYVEEYSEALQHDITDELPDDVPLR